MDNLFSTNLPDLNDFLHILGSSSWGATASAETIDNLFQFALHLQENSIPELSKKFPGINFNKSTDLLLESIIKNHQLNEQLTSYAIKKYINLHSDKSFSILLENITSEIVLRDHLFNLIQESPSVDLDFCKINNLLCSLDGPNCDTEIINLIKLDTSLLLDALTHCVNLQGPILIKKLINCLENQTDLRLWFILFKKENIQTVIKLCIKYSEFLGGVFVFFDKFANEIESTYDEDLNVKYSHVNLDFEDFVKVFQLFLNENSICSVVKDYLEEKTLLNKNYCFWIDLKSCIEY